MTKLAQRVAMLAFAAFALFAGSATTASAQKIAVIDVPTTLAALPEAQAASQKLDAARKLWTDSLQLMQNSYNAKMDAYSKVGETGSADFKKKAQEDLANLENTFMKYREEKFGQEGELAQMQSQLLKPIYEKISNALEGFAKKEKLTAIFYKNTAAYVDPSLDLTDKFTTYLKSIAQK